MFGSFFFIVLTLGICSALAISAWTHRTRKTHEQRSSKNWKSANVEVDESKLIHMDLHDLAEYRYQFLEDETEVRRATRKSRNVLCFIPVLLALSLGLLFLSARIGNVSAAKINDFGQSSLDKIIESGQGQITTPSTTTARQPQHEENHRSSKKTTRPKATADNSESYPLWLIPFAFSLLCVFQAWWVWIDWRSSADLITNLFVVEARVPPAWLPLMKVEYNRTPLSRVEDVDPIDTLASRTIGLRSWGSVNIRLYWENRDSTHMLLHSIPQHEAFVSDLLRAAKDVGGGTSLKQDLQTGTAQHFQTNH